MNKEDIKWLITVIVAIIGIMLTFFVPEIRRFFGRGSNEAGIKEVNKSKNRIIRILGLMLFGVSILIIAFSLAAKLNCCQSLENYDGQKPITPKSIEEALPKDSILNKETVSNNKGEKDTRLEGDAPVDSEKNNNRKALRKAKGSNSKTITIFEKEYNFKINYILLNDERYSFHEGVLILPDIIDSDIIYIVDDNNIEHPYRH